MKIITVICATFRTDRIVAELLLIMYDPEYAFINHISGTGQYSPESQYALGCQ